MNLFKFYKSKTYSKFLKKDLKKILINKNLKIIN